MCVLIRSEIETVETVDGGRTLRVAFLGFNAFLDKAEL